MSVHRNKSTKDRRVEGKRTDLEKRPPAFCGLHHVGGRGLGVVCRHGWLEEKGGNNSGCGRNIEKKAEEGEREGNRRSDEGREKKV